MCLERDTQDLCIKSRFFYNKKYVFVLLLGRIKTDDFFFSETAQSYLLKVIK